MPYSKVIEEKIERMIGHWKKMEKKKMFGGICYLLNGNMCFGIYKDYLIVRTGIDVAEKKLKEKNVKPFDITGKALKGWVMVGERGWKKEEDIKNWIHLGKEYALTLPKKHARTRNKKASKERS
jgi:TfoX/Sxy family transcriptional regulator of competence genes